MPTLPEEYPTTNPPAKLEGRAWWLGCSLVLLIALLATVPTVGDIGLTWDEPSYRTSQLVSAQWWEGMAKARTRSDFETLLSPEALLFYWPYGRYGYNFHPPLAGQLNLLTHAVFGSFMKDIPSRRMSSVLEYAFTITLLFGFLSKRYGAWVGAVAAGALLMMPRVYGDGHIAGTDTPGLLLWAITALAFWKGLYEPKARKWRILVGFALGLGFIEKMAAIAVVGPLIFWLVVTRLPKSFSKKTGKYDWIDGVVTSTAMLLPIGLAFREVLRLSHSFVAPDRVNLFATPSSWMPGSILALPLLVWVVRRLLGRFLPRNPVWGVERPALEIWTAILAFGPVVGWLGNPAWWRETLPRLAHYYQISADRQGALPDIRILYFGEIYSYSLPWHNAWVLIAITVPAGILLASLVGLFGSLSKSWKLRDAIPWYFALHLIVLPVLRMLPTPAHDGVRLLLPTFFFLAAFAGWGVVLIADLLAKALKHQLVCRSLIAALVLGSATWQLVKIHPFELSYYNEWIGGPGGAWKRGFELSYWYDAFNKQTLEEMNRTIPDGTAILAYNELINTPTMACLQELGQLKPGIILLPTDESRFPDAWLLTHDSKAIPLTRLIFAMTPTYSRSPDQFDGLRVATIASPEAVSRAWALDILTRMPAVSRTLRAPGWVRESPWLRPFARFWGEGVTTGPDLAVDERIFRWAKSDSEGLRRAARAIAEGKPVEPGSNAARLRAFLDRQDADTPKDCLEKRKDLLLRNRPEGLVEAVEILIARPDAVKAVLLRSGFTDVHSIGGFLDQDIIARQP
jgi:hypothetical protein